MACNKIMSLILIICLVLSITGCSTLDMMVGLKEDNNPDIADLGGLSEFEIVEDEVGKELNEEPVIETVTVNTEEGKKTDILAYYEDENG